MLDLQKYIGLPKIIVDTIDAKTTTYDLQYLPRGMGHTLGNAFRRIMLAYDMAASATGITIRWVTHEYQVVDGMITIPAGKNGLIIGPAAVSLGSTVIVETGSTLVIV